MTETDRLEQIERIKNALHQLAHICAKFDGKHGLLLFERLEKELQKLEKLEPQESAYDRLMAYG